MGGEVINQHLYGYGQFEAVVAKLTYFIKEVYNQRLGVLEAIMISLNVSG